MKLHTLTQELPTLSPGWRGLREHFWSLVTGRPLLLTPTPHVVRWYTDGKMLSNASVEEKKK